MMTEVRGQEIEEKEGEMREWRRSGGEVDLALSWQIRDGRRGDPQKLKESASLLLPPANHRRGPGAHLGEEEGEAQPGAVHHRGVKSFFWSSKLLETIECQVQTSPVVKTCHICKTD